MSIVIAGLAAFALTSLGPLAAIADDHPQEVLDLIAAHHALEMKIRPLQDRVAALAASNESTTGLQAEGMPLRAKVDAATEGSAAEAEKRMPETLTHRDRAASASDEYGRVKVRLSALAKQARAERERIMRPEFGVGTRQGDSESGSVRFGDGRHGARPPAGKTAQPDRAMASSANVDAQQIANARRKLAQLQHEYAGLERQVGALEAGAYERPKTGTNK